MRVKTNGASANCGSTYISSIEGAHPTARSEELTGSLDDLLVGHEEAVIVANEPGGFERIDRLADGFVRGLNSLGNATNGVAGAECEEDLPTGSAEHLVYLSITSIR